MLVIKSMEDIHLQKSYNSRRATTCVTTFSSLSITSNTLYLAPSLASHYHHHPLIQHLYNISNQLPHLKNKKKIHISGLIIRYKCHTPFSTWEHFAEVDVKAGSRGKERFRRPLGPALTSHPNLAPPNFLASVSTMSHSACHWPHPRATMS